LPTIALANGGFVISWTSSAGADGSGSGIEAQVFDASGNEVGAAFQVDTQATGDQSVPVITGLANGGFAIAWQDGDIDSFPNAGSGTLGDASGSSIKAQVFGLDSLTTISGTPGNDTLVGVGPSTLIGNGGNDTYRFDQAEKSEVIVNGLAGDTAPSGTLDFTAFAPNQLWLDHVGADLVIDVLGTTQKATIDNWYSTPGAQLASVQAGNSTLMNSQVDALVQAMSTFEANYAASHGGSAFDPATASPQAPAEVQNAIAANWHG
jgi:hypothetical protein